MMWLGTTLTSVTIYSQLLVVQNGFTVVYFVQGSAKGDYLEYDTNYTVDHCRLQVNSQWSTARRRVMLGTTVMPITVYSSCQWSDMDVEWFTLESGMLMETTLTCTVMISSPRDREALQAGRLGLSHWAGPSVTRSAREVSSLEQGYHG